MGHDDGLQADSGWGNFEHLAAQSVLTSQQSLSAVYGTPVEDAAHWERQETGFTCAVVAQQGIIEAFTGIDVPEEVLRYTAFVNGWLTTERGTSPCDMAQLLEYYGVPCHVRDSATISDLISELVQGHKVIVSVDSGELWGIDTPLEDFYRRAADHAIWVTGVDTSDPLHPKVIINDSGHPKGAGQVIDLELFVDAWEDGGFHLVATDNAPDGLGPETHGAFDAATGLFTAIAEFLERYFENFRENLSEEIEAAPHTLSGAISAVGGAALDAFIESLRNSPAPELDQANMVTLFRAI